jgi:two-component system response regulator (stage 0 sporulation protein F)
MNGNMKKILYVDDEEGNLYLFEVQMEDYFSVTTVLSGAEALEKLNEENGAFDFIVSDIKMPVMDGFEFLEKAKDLFPNIPRYILTAHYENEQILTSLDTGLIINWFQKPLNPQKFLDALNLK